MGYKDNKISFCLQALPYQAATTHFCFIGATGSGKTVNIRILMQSVFPDIGENLGVRALVYDAKGDMISILRGIIPNKNGKLIVPLNPFDTGSFAWNIAEDVNEPAHALEIASILIPSDAHASQPFFADAARALLEGVMTVFVLKRERNQINWTFRDVMNAMWDKDQLIAILRSEEYTQELASLYFSNEKTAENIMSEIGTKLGRYRIIASLWDYARIEGEREQKERGLKKNPRLISLTQWVRGKEEQILILGSDDTNKVALDAINQVLFKRITELILSEPDIDLYRNPKRIWVVLDEFARAGKLDGAVELATKGRSKGAAVVLGFQDINGLRAVYGKEIAEEIIGQCSNFAVLRLQSPDTAEWASRFFGNYRGIEKAISSSTGVSWGPQGSTDSTSTSVNRQIQERSAILASQFMLLPPVGQEDDVGVVGYFFSPYKPFQGAAHYKKPWSMLFSEDGCVWPKDTKWEEEVKRQGGTRRPGPQQYLRRWERADYERLGLLSAERKIELQKFKDADKIKDAYVKELAEIAQYRRLTADELQEIDSLPPEEKNRFLQVGQKNEERIPSVEVTVPLPERDDVRRKNRSRK